MYSFNFINFDFIMIFFVLTDIGKFKCLHKSSVWFLDFLALIIVVPLALIPPNITELLHWADPFFSIYFTDFNFCEPKIVKGKLLLLFNLNWAPNLLSGWVTLLKSLFDKLLSPIIFIGYLVLISRPRISLPKVPEFLASIVIFFYNYIL